MRARPYNETICGHFYLFIYLRSMRHLKYFGFVPNAFVWATMTTPYCEFVTVTAAARPLATLIEKRVILSAIYQKYRKTFATFRARQATTREHTTADFPLRVCTCVHPSRRRSIATKIV